ncbi:SDR family NAD(P)-dependent oxidoreductase [Planobispora rosea]|uniref:SDR family NAD(P)-dependent oxidoreductase n=1 Tax=Planobispora rosea TaxID=35762 RepID=UPI001FCFDA79|nr:SDR family NAD(P)-dependent oxidoreductase [Planobispora rosea]
MAEREECPAARAWPAWTSTRTCPSRCTASARTSPTTPPFARRYGRPPRGSPARTLYSAAKGAVQPLTLAMAADHLHEGVRVNCVNPGTADTPWIGRLLATADDPEAERAALEARPVDPQLGVPRCRAQRDLPPAAGPDRTAPGGGRTPAPEVAAHPRTPAQVPVSPAPERWRPAQVPASRVHRETSHFGTSNGRSA